MKKSDTINRTVRVCATGCRALGALDVYEIFQKELKRAKLDETIKLVKTGCQGLCAGAPLVAIDPDDILYVGVKTQDVSEIIKSTLIENKVIERLCYSDGKKAIKNRSKIPFFASQQKIVTARCGTIDPCSLDSAISSGAYEMLKKVLTPGLHLKIPFWQKAKLFNTQTLEYGINRNFNPEYEKS